MAGTAIRIDIFKRQLAIIRSSRRIGMFKYLWPPANSGRQCQNFMFPTISLITPSFMIPQKRYKLFQSRMNNAYTLQEIEGWYIDSTDAKLSSSSSSGGVFDADDAFLLKAELEGKTQQEYLLWVANAGDRLKEGRIEMMDEDRRSRCMRYFQTIEESQLLNYDSHHQKYLDIEEYHSMFYKIDTKWFTSVNSISLPITLVNDDDTLKF